MSKLLSLQHSSRCLFPALALSICLSAAEPPGAPAISAPPTIHPADAHRLSLGGKTFVIAGYYPSIGAFNTDVEDHTLYRRMIDAMADRGINYFRIAMNMGQAYGRGKDPYKRAGLRFALDGLFQFDLDQFNQEFFDYWRGVVDYARQRGIVVQLCLMDGWHAKEEIVEINLGSLLTWGLRFDYYFHANNVNGLRVTNTEDLYDPNNPVFAYQQAFIRKVVDTLGDLPNIVFEIANESGHIPWELLHADYLTTYERSRQLPVHLVMPRDLPSHEYVQDHCDNDPSRTHGYLSAAFSQNQVLISDNDCIDAGTPDVRRAKAWAALTAGGQIDLFHFELTSDSVLASSDAATGMRYVGFQQKFASDLGVDLAGMEPLDGEVSNGWALGRYGSEYVVYLPHGGATSIYSLVSTSRAVWFNPRDGSSFGAGAGGTTFTAPDDRDWVLYVVGQHD
jgi:hypothetical protein